MIPYLRTRFLSSRAWGQELLNRVHRYRLAWMCSIDLMLLAIWMLILQALHMAPLSYGFLFQYQMPGVLWFFVFATPVVIMRLGINWKNHSLFLAGLLAMLFIRGFLLSSVIWWTGWRSNLIVTQLSWLGATAWALLLDFGDPGWGEAP